MDKYINNSKKLIDENIHLYLFLLFEYIFFKKDEESEVKNKLEIMTKEINTNIIQKEDKSIEIKYSRKNFYNIINFIKTQNRNFAGEIVEDILIYIFSKVIKVDVNETIGKYIFCNLYELTYQQKSKSKLVSWFKDSNKLLKNEVDFKNIKKIIEFDVKKDYNNIFFYLIKEIFLNKKYFSDNLKNYIKTKSMKYIYKYKEESRDLTTLYLEFMDKSRSMSVTHSKAKNESDTKSQEDEEDEEENNIVLKFLISVFIYYQNKNSPLMKYIPQNENKEKNKENNKEDLVDIPFEYNLREANIESYYTSVVLSPLRIEPNISIISLIKNKFREFGLFELSKILLFNPNIKKILYNQVILKSYLLYFFYFGIGIFDNYSVTDLYLASNYLNEDCGEYLSKILSHFKEIKTLNLSNTELKSSASHLFILLKKLYRTKKIKLENLYINKCNLDDTSLYELGELLKSKYCKLKVLHISSTNKSTNFNFLKKIKENKSLEEINLTRSFYDNTDINDIKKIMTCTNIKSFYFSRNKITNMNNTIRIIYRTKLINKNELNQAKDINNINEDPYEINGNITPEIKPLLINFDISNNDAWILNKNHVNLIKEIINKTTLYCMDISHILYGPSPEKSPLKKKTSEYKKYINKIKDYLEKVTNKYKRFYNEKKKNKIDIKRLEEKISKSDFKDIREDIEKNFKKEIDRIIKKDEAKQRLYLIKESQEIVDKLKKSNNECYSNIKDKVGLSNLDNKSFKEFLANIMLQKIKENDYLNYKNELDNKKLILI